MASLCLAQHAKNHTSEEYKNYNSQMSSIAIHIPNMHEIYKKKYRILPIFCQHYPHMPRCHILKEQNNAKKSLFTMHNMTYRTFNSVVASNSPAGRWTSLFLRKILGEQSRFLIRCIITSWKNFLILFIPCFTHLPHLKITELRKKSLFRYMHPMTWIRCTLCSIPALFVAYPRT